MGCDVARQPLEARRQMAVVLQQTAAENLLTVRDNLLIYAYLHGVRIRDGAAAHAAPWSRSSSWASGCATRCRS